MQRRVRGHDAAAVQAERFAVVAGDETAGFAERRAAMTEADLRLFRHLLSDSGPLLGWTAPK